MENEYTRNLEKQNEELQKKLSVAENRIYELEKLGNCKPYWVQGTNHIDNILSHNLMFGNIVLASVETSEKGWDTIVGGYNVGTFPTEEEARDAVYGAGQPKTFE